MGRKDKADAPAAQEEKAEVSKDALVEEVEDTPFIKELKKLDDEYLSLERQYEKECNELRKAYATKQKPFLEQRRDALAKSEDTEAAKTGTPGCKGFWLEALKNHPSLADRIEEWDEPVLEYLKDITTANMDEEDPSKGFRIDFQFAENPFFTNTTLWKVYQMEESSPYTQEYEPTKIEASVIEWNTDKNITVEKVAKKVKGGGAKKNKQKKEKEEPRDSFFRHCFRSLEPGMPLPDDINAELEGLDDEDDDEPDERVLLMLMGSDQEVGEALRDHIVPFAVRWYTGEASPDDDDDDEDDEEEDDEDDSEEEESEEESEDEGAKKKGGKNGPKGGKPAKGSPATKAAADPNAKQEECKQQ